MMFINVHYLYCFIHHFPVQLASENQPELTYTITIDMEYGWSHFNAAQSVADLSRRPEGAMAPPPEGGTRTTM